MKILRADFIENYANCDESDAGYILIDELTKALMLFPRAANDIFGTEGKDPMDLAEIACNGVNQKQAERLVKLMLLVNRRQDEESFVEVVSMENDSMRSLFSKNGDLFDENKENIKAISSDLQSVLTDSDCLATIHSCVYDYANFGGDESGKKSKTGLWVALAVALGGVAYYFIRKKDE